MKLPASRTGGFGSVRRAIGAGILATLMLAGVAVVGGRSAEGKTAIRSGPGRGPTYEWEELLADPLDGGRRTTLAAARRELPFELLVPTHPHANGSKVEAVWVKVGGPGGGAVALVFSNGILLRERPSVEPDEAAEWQRRIAQGEPGTFRIIRWRPARVLEADADADGDNPAVVEMAVGDGSPDLVDGVVVTIFSENGPAAALADISGSIP